jgi:TonB family protein
MQQPAGLQRMVAVSILLHGMFFAGVLFTPNGFLAPASDPPPSVMTISLGGGGDGPRTGGLTSIGGRPVQVQTPPEEAPKREAVRPPAARTPEMTVPLPNAKKPLKAAPPTAKVIDAPDDARGRTPTRGAEVRAGTAVAETGVRGLGFGLATGGGVGSGSTLDVADFCCPEYLVTMVERIRSNWVQNAGSSGLVIVRFTIQRDGTLTQISLKQDHRDPTLGLTAQRAVQVTRQLPPLPAQFPNPTLTVNLNFEYQR